MGARRRCACTWHRGRSRQRSRGRGRRFQFKVMMDHGRQRSRGGGRRIREDRRGDGRSKAERCACSRASRPTSSALSGRRPTNSRRPSWRRVLEWRRRCACSRASRPTSSASRVGGRRFQFKVMMDRGPRDEVSRGPARGNRWPDDDFVEGPVS